MLRLISGSACSASTVTLMRHGLPSRPVLLSKYIDFDGEVMLIDRDDNGALLWRFWLPLTGEESIGRIRGSGEELPLMMGVGLRQVA